MSPFGRADLMATAAVRYCLGRSTYIVGDCVDWLHQQWGNLEPNCRAIIQRDIEEAITCDDRARADGNPYLPLGMDMDRQQWERARLLWAPDVLSDTRKLCTCDGAGRGPGRACVVKAGGRLGELWRCADGVEVQP